MHTKKTEHLWWTLCRESESPVRIVSFLFKMFVWTLSSSSLFSWFLDSNIFTKTDTITFVVANTTIITTAILVMMLIRCAGTETATYWQRRTQSVSRRSRIGTRSYWGETIIVFIVIIMLSIVIITVIIVIIMVIMVIITVIMVIIMAMMVIINAGQRSARKVLNHSLLAGGRPCQYSPQISSNTFSIIHFLKIH